MATLIHHEPREMSLLPTLRMERPFSFFRERLDSLLEDFFSSELTPFRRMEGEFMPRMEVKENDREMLVSMELPGMDEKDIELTLSGNSLTIKGEKKEEKEEKGESFYSCERVYGTFQRSIPLPQEVDMKKVDATFRKGVLHVKLPKTATAKESVKKIAIHGEH